MSKIFYDYYRVLGTIKIDQNKWDEYGSDIYMNIIVDSINNILQDAGFEKVSLLKKLYYKENDLRSKMFVLFKELIKTTEAWEVYPVLLWNENVISIEIRQKVEKLNVDPNDSNKIFLMLKKLMEGENNNE